MMDRMTLIAGPCVVEDYETTFAVAKELKEVCADLDIDFVFKASYRKANRTSWDSFETIGVDKALTILKDIKTKLDLEVTTDIHSVVEAMLIHKYNIDIVQIPAFLCRQTDILVAAAMTGKTVNIKKGQFADTVTMVYAVDKVRQHTIKSPWITERGTTFGYDDLVVDMRGILPMSTECQKMIVDLTHSMGAYSYTPRLLTAMGRASIGAGADGLFIETHPNPHEALSDGSRMIELHYVREILIEILKVWNAIKQ